MSLTPVSASILLDPQAASTVLAQSRVSDTEGDFFSSSWRSDRTMRATWSARLSVMPSGTLVVHDLLLALEVRVVHVEEQAAPLEGFGQLPGVVGGQEHQRDLAWPSMVPISGIDTW